MIYLCLCIAHSLTYMDMMYYYQKIPFLFIFTGYLVSRMRVCHFSVPSIDMRVNASFVACGILVSYEAVLVWTIIVHPI